MPLVPGLSPNLRVVSPMASKEDGSPVEVIIEESGGDVPEFDDSGAVVKINHGDGSITVSLDGKPLEEAKDGAGVQWFDNLAEKIDQSTLNGIAEDLLRAVSDDATSRRDWVEDRAQGMKLLGLRLEVPSLQGATDGAPIEGMSRVRHPLLQEAVLRFQANARSELLPSDGPVKMRDDTNSGSLGKDQMADALEKDINHYLTSTASEYYPDTDRMLLLLGFGGTAFKKVYFCPLRNRPVSETVDADDLIVNNSATDLQNASRVTHRIVMRPSVVKRLQILGVYLEGDLGTPREITIDAVQEEKNAIQGTSNTSLRTEDRDREIYEIYCELDLVGFGHKLKGKITGLELPYRVTIDVSSRKVLSIVRNYDEDTKNLPEARQTFVKYTFVPGMGFYDIGLLHILGNTTNAITAAWRELLDAGMYANFPGFLFSEASGRQNSNIFRIPPGGGAPVKTGGGSIRDAIMPLPYKEPSQALMALAQNMAETGMRVGGTSEQMVGEGKRDVPVGTTLALIEQATKVLNSVHKRLHASQCREFELLIDCFREHPESFWQKNRKAAFKWDEATFLKALDDVNLVPRADPNTASHAQRLMKVMALKQLQASNPNLYNPIAVDTAAIQAIGFADPAQFLLPPDKQQQPAPEILKGIEELKIAKQKADAGTKDADTKSALAQAKIRMEQAGDQQGPEVDPVAMMNAQTKARQVDFQMQRAEVEDQNRDEDRAADLALEQMRMDMQREKMGMGNAQENAGLTNKIVAEQIKQVTEHGHQSDMAEAQRQHERDLATNEGGHSK